MDGPPPPRELPLGKAVLLLVVGGEDDDTVVAVTDADEGRGGLIGRIEADMVLGITGCAVCQRFWAQERRRLLSGYRNQSKSQFDRCK